MKRLLVTAILMLLAAPLWAAQHLRLDLAGVGATDGPTPGFAVGADFQIDPEWFLTLRGSRLAEDDAASNSFAAGLEYGLADGEFVPYLGARVGGRWATEDVEECSTTHAQAAWSSQPQPPPPSCHSGSVESSGLLYQAALGADWLPKGSRFGATVEAAWTDAAGEAGVEFLVGVSFRP